MSDEDIFYFRLASTLGKSVWEIKNTMSAKEVNGWMHYFQLEPFGGERIQLALVAQVANNALGGKAKLDDLLLTMYNPKRVASIDSPPVTNEQVKAIFGSIARKSS